MGRRAAWHRLGLRIYAIIVVAVVGAGLTLGNAVNLYARRAGQGGVSPALLTHLVVLAGFGFAAFLLTRSISRPLERLASAARAIGEGDLAARTGVKRRDELGEVARAFDDMADRLAAATRAQTELLANVAHELRTPLTRIQLALDLASEGDGEAVAEALADIQEDLGDLQRLVGDILASARLELERGGRVGAAPTLRAEPLALDGLVHQLARRFRQRYPGRTIDVSAERLEIHADPALIRRALENLVDNARKYSGESSAIALRAVERGGEAVVEVEDRGIGIDEADLPKLFTPFFRTDRSRSRTTGGVGLGLSVARRIVEAHGGSISVRSAPGVGTTVLVALPRGPPRA